MRQLRRKFAGVGVVGVERAYALVAHLFSVVGAHRTANFRLSTAVGAAAAATSRDPICSLKQLGEPKPVAMQTSIVAKRLKNADCALERRAIRSGGRIGAHKRRSHAFDCGSQSAVGSLVERRQLDGAVSVAMRQFCPLQVGQNLVWNNRIIRNLPLLVFIFSAFAKHAVNRRL